MKNLNLKLLKFPALLLLFMLLMPTKHANSSSPQENDGTLVALVTWGDDENTPASDVYVEAHGYVAKLRAEKSFVLKMVRAGRYEASLPPGIYDVFISDGGSEPRCRRMRVVPGAVSTWTLKLEVDEIYTHF